MALLLIDGFEGFDDVGMQGTYNYQVPPSGPGPGVRTGSALRVSGGPSTGTMVLPASPTGFVLGLALAFTNGGLNFWLRDNNTAGGNIVHLTLTLAADGHYTLYRGNAVTQLARSINAFGFNTWNYVEIKIGAGGFLDAGTCQVRVNGTLEIDFAGDINNAGAAPLGVLSWNCGGAGQIYTDDMYLCDLTGPAPYNDYLGDVKVEEIRPSAAGASTQWTPSAGANWDAVNETPPSSTDYVGAAASGLRDLYAMTDLVTTSGLVLAVRPAFFLAKSDAGAEPQVRGVLRGGDGTVKVQSALSAQGVTYVSKYGAIETTQPNGQPWTIAEVNALQLGQETI